MTLDDALQRLAMPQGFPRSAIAWSRDHWAEIQPRIGPMLDATISGSETSAATDSALFFLLHIAGEKRDTRLHQPLCRLLHNAAVSERVLCDATTETIPGVLISTYDGDPAAMQAVVEDAGADEFTRGSTIMALAWLTQRQHLTNAWMRGFLWRLSEEMQPRGESYVWVDWALAVAALGYEELVPQAEELFARGWIDYFYTGIEEFRNDFQQSRADPEGNGAFGVGGVKPFISTIETFEGWHFDRVDDEETGDLDSDVAWKSSFDTLASARPYVNPRRDVGRNDPCPCGSGKKYKKCCLVA